MSQSMDMLVQTQLMSPIVQYSHMIGKEVTYIQDGEDGEKETVSSIVKSVSQKDGWAIFELENGEKIYADSIIKVSDYQDDGEDV